jgi:hypothetical protein
MDEHDKPPAPPDAPAQYDRRRGPRREPSGEAVEGERRSGERRKVPGWNALIDAILGVRRVKPPDVPKDEEGPT